MAGGQDLLLLAAFLPLVKCQHNPTVFMLPSLTQVFFGDLLLLKCNDSSSSSVAKWTLGDKELKSRDKTLRIAAATPKDSGSYRCEINGKKSDGFSVSVTEYAPTASLTIKTGHPVIRKYSDVILELENDDGLKGWSCRIMRGEETGKIGLRVGHNPVSLDFHSPILSVSETILWCVNRMGNCRSNQVTIRTSDKSVSLEMYPLPALAGESLILKCLVWGTNKVFTSVFYKDGIDIKQVRGSETYTINNMTESQVGTYKCDATYKYVDQTAPNSHTDTSDPQEVPVSASPIRAELSEDMHCSCSPCDSSMSYRYYKKTGDSWTMLNEPPKGSGTYRCRAVKDNMRTLPSRSLTHSTFPSIIVGLIVVLLLLGFIVAIVALLMCKKRRVSGPVYEDVGLKLQGDAKEPEYDTIQPGATGRGEQKGGEYTALKKEMKESEYDTLGKEGASGGEGGYQELKKGERTQEVYHTLGDQVRAEGDSNYESLKKEEIKESAYDTLEEKGASGGEGGYQELKKGERTQEVYHTLGDQVRAEGDSNYESLKKEEIKESAYDTLEEKGASGGEGGYQELKKGQRTQEVYHTLGDQVRAEGDSNYESLKKEEIQNTEYERLQTREAERRPDRDVDVVEGISENK